MNYFEDLNYAAKSDPNFDRVNSEMIGNDHGEDPAHVLKEILNLRKLLKEGINRGAVK